MTNAVTRQLPELTFDDVGVTIHQLAEAVTGAISERITAITKGDRTISYNRINMMQTIAICSALFKAVSSARAEEIKKDSKKQLEKCTQIFEKNTNLLSDTITLIEYIHSAKAFFAETKVDHEATLNAKRKTEVEKNQAKDKVLVCNKMLDFLIEHEVSAETMKKTIDHNRNGRKGEEKQLSQLKTTLADARTWGSLVSGGIGWFFSKGGSKPAEALAPVEGGGSVVEAKIEEGKVEPSVEIIEDRPVATPITPKKESFKDAVEQPSRTQIGRVRDPKTALRLRVSTS